MFSIDRAKTLSILNGVAGQLDLVGISFRVLYWGITPEHGDNPIHRHSFFEVCYVMDGQGSYMDEGHHYPLDKGTLFCSRPGALHQIRSRTGLYLLFVAFELDESRSTSEAIARYRSLYKTSRIVLQNADHTPAALLWRALISQFEQPHMLTEPFIRGNAHSLLLSFSSGFTDQTDALPHPSLKKVGDRLLLRATAFIKDNLWRPLPLDTVAEYLNVSGRHLSRLFAQRLGISYVNYVRRERVRHASDLLKYSEIPIKEVAEKSGFSSVHYFSNVFAKEMGLPPGRFREAASNPEENHPADVRIL